MKVGQRKTKSDVKMALKISALRILPELAWKFDDMLSSSPTREIRPVASSIVSNR